MAALVSLADVKTRLNIAQATTTFDDQLTALIAQVSALVISHVKSPITQATYTDYLDGTDSPWLVLPRRWVQSVTSVSIDRNGNYGTTAGSFPTLLTSGVDYAWRPSTSLIWRVNGVWGRYRMRLRDDLAVRPVGPLPGSGNIKVIYVAGFAVVPDDLQLAVIDTIALARAGAGRGGFLQSESYDGYSYSLAGLNTSAAWMGYLAGPGGAILNNYRRIPV